MTMMMRGKQGSLCAFTNSTLILLWNLLELLQYIVKILSFHCYVDETHSKDQFRPVRNWLRPQLVKTSLVTTKRLRPTTEDQSLVVQSGLLGFLSLQGPVLVSVQASRRPKTRPDQTFKHYWCPSHALPPSHPITGRFIQKDQVSGW